MQEKNSKTDHHSGSCDFVVRIQFRQNATWQGEIEWLGERGKSRRWFFRSLLEMICLMQEALEKEGIVKADCELRSWDDSNPTQEV